MDTKPSPTEARVGLEEKFRVWKETHLPAGNASLASTISQLNALGTERLKAAYDDAVAGLIAERMLDVPGHTPVFHLVAGMARGLLITRGVYGK